MKGRICQHLLVRLGRSIQLGFSVTLCLCLLVNATFLACVFAGIPGNTDIYAKDLFMSLGILILGNLILVSPIAGFLFVLIVLFGVLTD